MLAFGAALLVNVVPSAPAQVDQLQTIVRQIQAAVASADSPEDRSVTPTASESFADLFKPAGRSGVSELQAHADGSIALQAAWQEVVVTVPAGRSRTTVRPDRDKLAWFLGFLEGRARVKVPRWWAWYLLESRAYSPDEIHPGIKSENEWINDHHKTGLDFVCTPRDTSLKREGDNIVLQIGGESVRFPVEVFTAKLRINGNGGLSDAVSGLITCDRCYLAVHDNTGYPHMLYCVDRPTGKTTWKTKVWGNFWGNIEGKTTAWVSLVEGDGKVFVFGASSGMNVEAFRIEDGKPVFRFATTYLSL